MIIYNTTFHIDNDSHHEFIDYLKKEFIPQSLASGLLTRARLSRILSQHVDEGESYSLQYHVKDNATLNEWITKEGQALQQSLVLKFKEKVVGFTTLLEEVELDD